MRLIDADALIEAIENSRGKNSIYAQFVRAWIKEAPTVDAVPKWIPRGKRLPKEKEVVLITNSEGNVRCGQFRGTSGKHLLWIGNILEMVEAWMPLPEPYKGEMKSNE